jgi:hypothetical protein
MAKTSPFPLARLFGVVPLVSTLIAGSASAGVAPAAPPSSGPVTFEAVPDSHGAHFVARGADTGVLVTDRGLAFTVVAPAQRRAREREMARVDLTFEGARPPAAVEGTERQAAESHYLVGAPRDFRTNVARYGGVAMTQLWHGVDLRLHGRDARVEYDFIVAPGADPRAIRLRLDGARGARLDAAGDLRVETAAGTVTQRAPVAYQEISGKRVSVDARFVLEGGRRVRFALGRYDHRAPLVIDPVLLTSKRVGGNNFDQIFDMTTDASGNVYVTGISSSPNLPVTAGAPGTTLKGQADAFVAKYDAAGALKFMTYYGGTGTDAGTGIGVDSSGNVYVAGYTVSTDLPTFHALQATATANTEGFVLALAAAGNAIKYATYFGATGAGEEVWVDDVAVAASNAIWISGSTNGRGLPLSPNGFQRTPGGGFDAFVLKLDPTQTGAASAKYFTYYGGNGEDGGYDGSENHGTSITLRPGGGVYVAGLTDSTNLTHTTSVGPLGGGDAFVLKTTGATTFEGSVVVGGSDEDTGHAVATDAAGNIYLAGETWSTNLPTTSQAWQQSISGADDVYVVKLSSSFGLLYGTYLGGTANDEFPSLAVSPSGVAHLLFTTNSPALFTTTGAVQSAPNGDWDDLFFARFNALGGLSYGTFLGGPLYEESHAIALAGTTAIVAGSTSSDTFPGAGATLGSTDGVFAKFRPTALFVVGNTTLSAGDTAIRNRLQSLGFAVTIKSGPAVVTEDGLPTDLIFVSSTVASGDVGGKFTYIPVPVITCEGWILDDMAMTNYVAGSDYGNTASQTQLALDVGSSDLMSGGLSGTQALTSSGKTYNWGRPYASAVRVAHLTSDTTKSSIFRYETGALMSDNIMAQSRRVGFFLWDDTATALTTNGWKLFDASVKWAAGF